jgi:hypothetical protein
MKRIRRWLIPILLIAFSLGCLAFLFVNVNRGITLPQQTITPTPETVDLLGQTERISKELLGAPWQGLRFLPKEKEWRFYGWTGETNQVELNATYDLIKVYYLQADGDLTFTWVVIGIEIPGQGYQSTSFSAVQPGQLVAVRLYGKHVSQWGVNWSDCDSEYCHLASMIDTMLILDDQGTGLSNGFIRFGWEPPTYPMYGFLCWTIDPMIEHPQQVLTRQ